MSTGGDGYVTPMPPRPGGSSRLRWLGVIAGFAVLVGVVVLQRHSGNAPAAADPAPSSTSGPTPAGVESTSTGPTSTAPTSTGPTSTPRATTGTGLDAPTVNLPLTPSSLPWTSTPGPSADTPATTAVGSPPTTTANGLATTLTAQPSAMIPGEKGWEIIGYGVAGLVRIDPATGRVVLVPGPDVISANPAQGLVSVRGRTLVTSNGSPALVFPDAGPVALARGDLSSPQFAAQGPDPGHLWVSGSYGSSVNGFPVKLVDWAGKTSAQLTLPPYVSPYGVTASDGAGYLLAGGIGGMYDVRPGGARLLTHGQILATGPTGYLAYECGDTPACQAVVIDRATGSRRILAATPPANPLTVENGQIAPNGRYAAFESYPALLSTTSGMPTSPELHLIDLPSGRDRVLDILMSTDGGTAFAFSPDGRYLVVATLTNRIAVVDTATGTVRTLPSSLPAVNLVTVRPTAG